MLVELLEQEAVPFETLHTRYGSLLELVRKLLGVVPNCDSYLEIWPPAFRTYNVMVPNLLNLPFPGWGLGAPRSTVGLAMYVSSRTANGGSAPLLPAAPGAPSSAGSTSSGLGSSAGGLGLGVLALIFALSPLGLRLLRHSPNILRPNSALVLAIERPG